VIAGWVHAPLLQVSVVHSLVSSQPAQATPPVPHAVALVPATHEVPFQQPVQQLLA
jgi:hypothetical protein